MALPTVRMETASPFGTTLTLSTGVITVTAGRANVPLLGVSEAIAKGFTISDPGFAWPPRKNAMIPPSSLGPVFYSPAPAQPLAASSPGPGSALFPNNTAPMGPAGYGTAEWSEPAVGGHYIDPKFAPAYRPQADATPYASVALPGGGTLNVPYPGRGIAEIPEAHITYFKSQGWTLVSDVLTV